MTPIQKYPRTQHIAGSGIQAGDAGLEAVPFRWLAGRHLVIEEKMDGANCAVSFTPEGGLLLQSRGHYLAGGPRERQFHLFKAWAGRYQAELWVLLSGRYVLYGEWLYAKHTIFYTDLPHYFMEFDIYDRQADLFLSTERRAALLQAAPFVVSVRVLHSGTVPSLAALQAMIGRSAFIADDHQAQLHAACAGHGLDPVQVQHETDPSWLMEGLYIKTEEAGCVTGRYKYVRAGFLQTVLDAESHWQDRPLLPNCLRAGVTLF